MWQPETRNGIYRDEFGPAVYPGPDLPDPPVTEQPAAPTLAEWIDRAFPGFWERGAGGVS